MIVVSMIPIVFGSILFARVWPHGIEFFQDVLFFHLVQYFSLGGCQGSVSLKYNLFSFIRD